MRKINKKTCKNKNNYASEKGLRNFKPKYNNREFGRKKEKKKF